MPNLSESKEDELGPAIADLGRLKVTSRPITKFRKRPVEADDLSKQATLVSADADSSSMFIDNDAII